MRNQRIGIVALVWLLLLMAVTMANAQHSVKTSFFPSGRAVEITVGTISSDTTLPTTTPTFDMSSMDGQTIYYSAYMKSSGSGDGRDSVRAMLYGRWVTSTGLTMDIPLDSIWIQCRSGDSARTIQAQILQTPTLSLTGFAPTVYVKMRMGTQDGDGHTHIGGVGSGFIVFYSRVEDAVPPFRKLQNAPY